MLEDNEGPTLKLQPYKEIFKSSSSPECLQLAREWLVSCESVHAKCKEDKSAFEYPTRLIEIADGAYRLVTIDLNSSRSTRYVALSHCWGKAQPLKTCRANIDRHMENGVSQSELPATFIDASKSTSSSVSGNFEMPSVVGSRVAKRCAPDTGKETHGRNNSRFSAAEISEPPTGRVFVLNYIMCAKIVKSDVVSSPSIPGPGIWIHMDRLALHHPG